ncbi:calcium-translocating P-type ATPase, PMCA-type [[Clostridium] leptum]|nr:calcium-translocating P-type ATPase, PMCA-type [[Clostridium] leptum]
MIWHNRSIEDIEKELHTSATRGLTQSEAAAHLDTYGLNRLTERKKKTFLQRFLEQMKDFMVIILLIAAAVSAVLTIVEGHNDWLEPIIIIAIVLLNAFLGVIQESKAEAALEALKGMSAPNAKVLRDGIVSVINAEQLVPGDIILLDAGDFIPADARLLESASLKCEESALTGESLPVEKDASVIVDEIAPLGDRVNMVYSGCSVTYGRGKAMVTETGMSTEMGRIASMLNNESENQTPLQIKLAKLGKTLGLLALGICAVLFVYGIVTGQGLFDMFMTAVSLAVAAIPEGLPAIVTIVLAMGVRRMVKKNAIIRRLPAVETLGSASVICSDKTGTLTQNRMTLMEVYTGGKMLDLSDTSHEGIQALLRLGVLCNDGRVEKGEDGTFKHVGDPTETALVAAGLHFGIDKGKLETEYPRVSEIPFDSDRKLMTTVNYIDGKYVAIVKGAPDILLSRCVDGHPEEALKVNDEMASRALRVLAIAYKDLDAIPVDPQPQDLEQGLHFAGLVGMIDPPRPEVIDAIKTCKGAGIRPIMITGDHIATASAIAKELGILEDGQQAITGAQLAQLSEEELRENIRSYSVYARVSPEDKIRIVKAWQDTGEVVSMTGDGVNDAPALKAADIGCAMGITGTDVSKGASDMVLTDDNFATIVSAVQQGRGIFDNIRKAVIFLLSCNLGEVLAVFVCMLLFGRSPLLPIHLLWINLVTDSLPALALGMEPVEFDVMNRRPRAKNESIFANGMGWAAGLQGLMLGAITLMAYWLGCSHFFSVSAFGSSADPALGQTMAFGVLALSQLFQAFNARSRHSLFRIGPFSNRWMIGAFFASAAILMLVLLLPPLRSLFQLVALPLHEWEWILALSISPIVLVELSKFVLWISHKWKNRVDS